MNKQQSIAILGCGWLGIPLAESLIAKGFSVKGSTTSSAKIDWFSQKKIIPFQLILNENKIEGEIDTFLKNTDVLIITVPPKAKEPTSDTFPAKLAFLLPYIEKSTVEKVLFISSISVYPDVVSYNNKVTEGYVFESSEMESNVLLQSEQLLLNNSYFKTTVLRFGGLVGLDRHPINYLAGKTNLENPEAPINLIHLEDCIGAIEKILSENCWGEVFNAVAPIHPNRENYYQQKAKEMQLPLPIFTHEKPSVGKTISSEKLIQKLHYTFSKTDF
ncbi:SDR family NAD(P)-dependent oxidoreductase [Flavobacterium sp.]|uniref:SDR family NAD(P)-dependent oxidoreductase n=1 Tax=Flavobacterium sp. TaxID=239 RepID=UPI0028BD8E33|nr:SDR family NAD(P)-dependent oxidoreductase [Flavobacterium sp.]